METLKQSAISAISQLPETANINDIIVVLYKMKSSRVGNVFFLPTKTA